MSEQRKVVTSVPENSETPLEDVCSWVTPTRLFFVRSHFDTPAMNVEDYRLTVGGLVESSLELTWDDLNALPQRTVFATMECAGNGRSFLRPPEHGVQWGAGAIAHAEWTGVSLARVLETAGLSREAVELVFEGADSGRESGQADEITFRRGLPIDKALDPDTLLALRMNGEPLEPAHGFPVRLLVPGWYGVASVKWLTRIDAVAEPFDGYFQTTKYTVQRRTRDGLETVGVQGMAVKSEIIRPAEGETLAAGPQRAFGLAWAGDDAVASVEVSLDGGEAWDEAQLMGPQAPRSWSLWEYTWTADLPGEHEIVARATSSSGQRQPLEHDPLRGGYMINFCRPRRVRVAAVGKPEPALPKAETLLYDMNAFAEANAAKPLDVELAFSHGAGI